MSMKGSARLAGTLQRRMKQMDKKGSTVSAEMGEIKANKGLKLDSLPDVTLSEGDYSLNDELDVAEGDRVLVIWTYDGEPVIAFKVKE